MSEGTPTTDVILDELLDLPPADRPRRLEMLCGSDAALRRDVESLLDAYERSGDFLEQPIAPVVSAQGRGEWAGRRIGSYELSDPLGHGGMGHVHLAHRVGHDYEQTVAIKIVHASILAPEALRRFHNECRVLARLDHPNIARMIEGGIDVDGTPYLAMEYVDGRPIDLYCQQEGLSVRERVALFRDVCAAVSHLHHHSSIHRDIKPDNVLVKDDGQVKLIDFSIARILDIAEESSGDRTVEGYERMTPAYASPEQLRGEDLSTATDVYSLGVLLYRILTGTLPFRGRSRDDVEREVSRSTVRRPSDAATGEAGPMIDPRQLRGDLDTITLMSLRLEPERRYPSVQHLSEDLERYLQNRPVLARGDSWTYRTERFVRRNTAVVVVLALLAVTLVASTVVSFALYTGAERARAEAVAERESAKAVGDFLATILSAADPAEREGGALPSLRDVLERADKRIAAELSGQGRLATELRLTIGRAYHNLGILDASLEQYAQARAVLPPGFADLSRRVDVREAQTRMLLEQVAVADSLLVAALSDSSRLRPETRAIAYLARAQLGNQTGRYDEAMLDARRAHRLGRSLPGDSLLLSQTASMVGEIAYRLGDGDTSIGSMREAVEVARAGLGPRHTQTAIALQNLGAVLRGTEHNDEAIEVLEEALGSLRHVYGDEHVETANTSMNLADALQFGGHFDRALDYYAMARRILERVLGVDSYRYGTVLANEASTLEAVGRHEDAERGFREAIGVYERSLGEQHPWTAIAQIGLARLLLSSGRHDEAFDLGRRAESTLEGSFPQGSPSVARAICVQAEVDLFRGRIESAGVRLERAIEMIRSLVPSHPDRIMTVLLFARQLEESGRADLARQELQTHLDEIESHADPDTASVRQFRQHLSRLAGR